MVRALTFSIRLGLLSIPLFLSACTQATSPPPMYAYEEMMRCPDWVKEDVPVRIAPWLGRHGLPSPYAERDTPIGVGTWGIDFWQANHFVAHRSETADYLYTDYTPLRVDYRQGTLPTYEKVVAEYCEGIDDDTEKAVVLLTRAMPALMRHPFMAPLGPACQTDRNLADEPLLASGVGFCNEQARVYVRLCQVAGIPSRLIFLFYADRKGGHVVAEFYTQGRWQMADASWFCVFPDSSGGLMSAAECHREGEGKAMTGIAYHQRMREIVALDDESLAGGRFVYVSDPMKRKRLTSKKADELRADLGSRTADELGHALWTFGVMNYPCHDRNDSIRVRTRARSCIRSRGPLCPIRISRLSSRSAAGGSHNDLTGRAVVGDGIQRGGCDRSAIKETPGHDHGARQLAGRCRHEQLRRPVTDILNRKLVGGH